MVNKALKHFSAIWYPVRNCKLTDSFNLFIFKKRFN